MSEPLSLSALIDLLGLTPLEPEGGLIRLNYLASLRVEAQNIHGQKQNHPQYSAIYYLLTNDPDSFSAFHRLPSDEIYHHYVGLPVELCLISPNGDMEVVTLGDDLAAGQRPQVCVPAFCWQASQVVKTASKECDYALLGTTMAPGYIEEDFELGEREQLLQMFPHYAEVINHLTRQRL